jgi:hypothetical protein
LTIGLTRWIADKERDDLGNLFGLRRVAASRFASSIAVSVKPGETTSTVISRAATSLASVRHNCSTTVLLPK